MSEYWWNKLRFLFTGKLVMWTVQENCDRDFSDCSDCGAGLYHWSSDFFTRDDAMKQAKDMLEQQIDTCCHDTKDYEIVINDTDPNHVVFTLVQGGHERQFWYEVIKTETERRKTLG